MDRHRGFTGIASSYPISRPFPLTVADAGPYTFASAGGAVATVQDGLAVVFNGRLDSPATYGALRSEARVDISTAVGDAYRRNGPRTFPAGLIGDFALALWDAANRRLVLTRSPSGLHPLCYVQHGSVIHFASTPQDLFRAGLHAPSLDEQGMAEWLVLQPHLSTRTLFSGVHRVAPGSSVIFERDRLESVPHWQPDSLQTLYLKSHKDYADLLRETLRAAVAKRLPRAGEGVATQLSGGLDSSSVTALAAEELAPSGRRVYAFTAVPGAIAQDPVQGRFLDESAHAAAVAARYGNISHRLVRAEQSRMLEVLDRYTDIEAGPPPNPHHIQWIDSTYAAAAATGVHTMLTGSMGNTTISAAGTFAFFDALQQGRFGAAAAIFLADRRSGARRFRNLPAFVVAAYAPGMLDAYDRLRNARTGAEEFSGVRAEYAAAHGIDLPRWNSRFPAHSGREYALYSMRRFDLGMFHEAPRRLYGLDVADPTFDRQVVELTLRIPLEQFCADGVPRALIRTAMRDTLPDVVRLERRRGLQSADFLATLERERHGIAAEFARMAEIDILRRAIDVPALQERLHWSARQAIDYGWHPYSNRLMRGLSIGRFVRRLMDGTLFSTLDDDAGEREAGPHLCV